MARRVEQPDAMGNSAVFAYRNAFRHRDDTTMSNSCAAAYNQYWPVHVPCGECNAALPVEQHIVADDDVAAPLYPMHVDIGSKIASVTPAVPLEERFGD